MWLQSVNLFNNTGKARQLLAGNEMSNMTIKPYDTGFQAILRTRTSNNLRSTLAHIFHLGRNREAAEIVASFEREVFANETAAVILSMPMKQKAKILSLPTFREEAAKAA